MPLRPLLLSACASSVEGDFDRYRAIVGDPHVQAVPGVEACEAIGDADLAGDCGLHVATVEARREGGRPVLVCEAMRAGLWRDECWFVSAENARRRGRNQYAATLCLEAGVFVDDCAQHLWQSSVHKLLRHSKVPGFAHVMQGAQRIYDDWAPHLSADTDFERRFWAKVYQNGFEGFGTADLGWCEELRETYGEEHVERCVSAAVELYERELGPRLERAGVDICSLEHPTSASLNAYYPVPEDPRLDEIILVRQARECQHRR